MVTEALPESIALHLDDSTRRSRDGRTALGGSPLRVLRFSPAGARVVDHLAAGAPVGSSATASTIARRLLDGGLAHPRPGPPSPDDTVGMVVPVRDHAADLATLLAVRELPTEIVVVDDGSADPVAVREVADGRARVVRRQQSGGPGVARNAGWRCLDADIVVFVDADVLPEPGWLDRMLAHFRDPTVAAVAPRVRGRRASVSLIDRYESYKSPLDLGPREGRVAPRSRIGYVPTATVAYRRTALEALGGFDEGLRVGEDVDLVWRTVAAGWTVRYEPAAVVTHRNRPSWAALVRQRITYGSSAAALDRRHPGSVAPVDLNAWSLAAWTMPVAGGFRGAIVGVITAAGSATALVPTLRGRVDEPIAEAARLGGLGNLWAGRWLAHAIVRAWLPLAAVAGTRSRRVRRATAAALVVPSLLEWRERRPDIDPLRWVALRALDDSAYCVGVWVGCVRARSFRSLLPRLSAVPGLTRNRRKRR